MRLLFNFSLLAPVPAAPAAPILDKATLLRQLEVTNPLTLALAREWEDIATSVVRVGEAVKS